MEVSNGTTITWRRTYCIASAGHQIRSRPAASCSESHARTHDGVHGEPATWIGDIEWWSTPKVLEFAYVDVVMEPVCHDNYCEDDRCFARGERYGEEDHGLAERGRPEKPVEGDEVYVCRVDDDLHRKDEPESVLLRDQPIDADGEEHGRDREKVDETGGHFCFSGRSTFESTIAPRTAEARTR